MIYIYLTSLDSLVQSCVCLHDSEASGPYIPLRCSGMSSYITTSDFIGVDRLVGSIIEAASLFSFLFVCLFVY